MAIRRLLLALFVLVAALLVLVDIRVRPALGAAAQTVAKREATQALNEALQRALSASPTEDEILHVQTDSKGEVRFASFDFRTVSQVEALATEQAEESLEGLNETVLPLPVSQSIGSAMLSVLVPDVPVRIRLLGSAHASVRMDVHSVGINQTVHTLQLVLTAEVRAIAPLVSQPVDVTTSMPMAYVVLSGEIPDTYLSGVRGDKEGNHQDIVVLPPGNDAGTDSP